MLKIRQLVKVYPGAVTALQGIDLDVPRGMFGLLGPNGAGKTTLMRIVAGLLEPTSGTVLLDEHDVAREPEYIWQRLGYLPQDFGFYPYLTGEAMLEYLLKIKGVSGNGSRRKLARELLQRVNLGPAARRRVKTYSGGMKQRLGIAQALAGDPDLIIVDEPTAGLDPEERYRFYHLLSELAEDRIILLSTHIVEDVAVLCPRMAIIRDGRLVSQTSPDALRASMDGSIFEGSARTAAVDALSAHHCVIQNVLVSGRARIRIYDPNHQPPEGFQSVPATLEDAYLVLMKQNGSQLFQSSGSPVTAS